MKVVLDARPLQSASGARGIGRYVRELARHLPGTGEVEETFLLLDAGRPSPLGLPEGKGLTPMKVRRPPGPAVIVDRMSVIREVEESGAEIFHATYLPPPRLPQCVSTVMTVHDLTPLQVPGSVPFKAGLVFRMAFAGARRCRRIVVPSQATADAVERLLGIPSPRITVTHLGVDTDRFDASKLTAEPLIQGRYLLHVGGFDATKNLSLLLDVMERLAARPDCADVRLAVVGDGGDKALAFVREATRRGLDEQLVLPGRLEDQALAGAYAGAQLFLFPSRAEGFGLPVLEAQAAGCPVLAADAASLPEVLGDAGRLLSPDDPDLWASEAQALLSHPEERQAMREAGLQRARRFSWAATAARTVEAYRLARGAA